MIHNRRFLLVGLVFAAIALSACGSSGGSSTSSTAGSSVKSGVAAAKQKCLDATKKIQNSTAQSVAEQACDQITTNNANVNAALSKAKAGVPDRRSQHPDRLGQAGC